MDVRAGLLVRDQTVIVHEGLIARIGPAAEVEVPSGARRVDGEGRFLAPGLIDSHVHSFMPEERWLYLAAGITTVVNLHGTQGHLDWRSDPERIGPHFITAGPILDGHPPTRGTNTVVTLPEAAREEVARQAVAGFDLIKIYDNLSPEAFAAVIDEARRQGITVTGHVPTPVGLDAVLAAAPTMRAIQHVEELLPFAEAGTPEQIHAVAASIAESGVFVIPTAVVYASGAGHERGETGDWGLVSPVTVANWGWEEATRERANSGRFRFGARLPQFPIWIRALHDAGVPLLAGSDAPIPTLVPGHSLHWELTVFQEAGLQADEVLRTATMNAAEFLQRRAGVVEEGYLADLILLEANPLESLTALERPAGVMLAGLWLPGQRLQAEVSAIRAEYAAMRGAR